MSSNNPWPPEHLQPLLQGMSYWQAWYAGDRASLENAGANREDQNAGLRGLLVKAWQYFWGGKATTDGSDPEVKVHVPLAKDIAKAGRAMLFAVPPTMRSELETTNQASKEATDAKIQEYVDNGLMLQLAGGAEIAAALGGVYFRVIIDYTRERTFVTRINPYKADPVFRWGEMVEVTFWRELPSRSATVVYRHLERHFLALDGTGMIEHLVYEGAREELGTQVAIDTEVWPSMQGIVDTMGEDGLVSTLTPGLDVVYIPNTSPNALWLDHEVGQNLGLPDIQGSEDALDSLDRLYSSMLEEYDLAKARITVPEYMLRDKGAGQGSSFDRGKRIWTTFSVAPTSTQEVLQLFQPDIRVEQHLAGMQELTEVILRSSGYSAQTFGEDETGGAVTATEINARDRRTRITRGDKIAIWGPKLEELLFKMLSIEKATGWGPLLDPMSISIAFPKETDMTPQEAALFVSTMMGAGAMSLEIGIATAHADWDKDAVDAEVERVQKEQAEAAPEDPTTFTGDPTDG